LGENRTHGWYRRYNIDKYSAVQSESLMGFGGASCEDEPISTSKHQGHDQEISLLFGGHLVAVIG